MLTLPITTPVDFDFVLSAETAHTGAGLDFPEIFDNFFQKHYVVKTPEFFLMAGEDPNRSDAWFVWWAELHPFLAKSRQAKARMHMLRRFLSCVPYHKPYIGWARMLKGRSEVKYYSTSRLVSFTKPATSNDAQRNQTLPHSRLSTAHATV